VSRVVPSMIVQAIGTFFPEVEQADSENSSTLSFFAWEGSIGHLQGLVRLLDQIPDELYALDAIDYTALLVDTESLRSVISKHISGAAPRMGSFGPEEPPVGPILYRLRHILSKCPDYAPSQGTPGILFIKDPRLQTSIREDISSTHALLRHGEWKACTVMAGSVLEALLLWALQDKEASHPGTIATAYSALTGQRPTPDPRSWGLNHLMQASLSANLISQDGHDLGQKCRGFRNLIHPGRAERLGQRCTRSTALAAVAAMERIIEDLSP
jgi:hypothetical protein